MEPAAEPRQGFPGPFPPIRSPRRRLPPSPSPRAIWPAGDDLRSGKRLFACPAPCQDRSPATSWGPQDTRRGAMARFPDRARARWRRPPLKAVGPTVSIGKRVHRCLCLTQRNGHARPLRRPETGNPSSMVTRKVRQQGSVRRLYGVKPATFWRSLTAPRKPSSGVFSGRSTGGAAVRPPRPAPCRPTSVPPIPL